MKGKFIFQSMFCFVLVLSNAVSNAVANPIPISNPIQLANLNYSNPALKDLREDVKSNLQAVRSRSNRHSLTKLRFYSYVVKKEDNFFQIMAKTGMDMDSLTSVNELASPHDIYPGQKLLIPNMRGIYISEKKPSAIYDELNQKWFLPDGRLEGREKMFFYGKAFGYPLEEFRLTSRFGKRSDPFTNKQTFHGGLDMAAPAGTPILASADGWIEFVGKRGGYGNLIILKHEHGYETRYGHLSQFVRKNLSGKKLKKGVKIKKGEKIGEVGMTGRATGNHLHFEVRRFSKPERPVLR